ncbi:hypothetical protein BRADI_4g06323v3 [Brachypodium distachyon]|uniref:Uncharacterized protein n=1 Tax=Brachypodium distachyon TaxID=15368 RepID=A0A2K2CKU1_BRADI|nr:hypothetical protein BRADI_4g06323v3 [Brachypodium distachyon]PNT62639.1 hypothetical protein BRADI_4g06323v3 [Brachypodium distachyon]
MTRIRRHSAAICPSFCVGPSMSLLHATRRSASSPAARARKGCSYLHAAALLPTAYCFWLHAGRWRRECRSDTRKLEIEEEDCSENSSSSSTTNGSRYKGLRAFGADDSSSV